MPKSVKPALQDHTPQGTRCKRINLQSMKRSSWELALEVNTHGGQAAI